VTLDQHLTPAQRASRADRPEIELAERQYGVITYRQLLGCGLRDGTIDRWLRTGRLTRLHRAVYALGHSVLVPDGRRLAAVLACGSTARLAEHDAGAVHGICAGRGSRFAVVVQPNRARGGPRTAIHIRESALTDDDVSIVRGIPVTSLARTIVDIAARTPGQVEAVIDAAFALDVFDQAAMDRQLATGRRGVGVVRRELATRHPDAHDTRSRWERRMLALLDAHRLPRPEVNPSLVSLGLSPDLLWRSHGLVVEWDSWAHHGTRARFEADRDKTVRLQTAGFTVLRFTWRQTHDEPEAVIAAIRTFLT